MSQLNAHTIEEYSAVTYNNTNIFQGHDIFFLSQRSFIVCSMLKCIQSLKSDMTRKAIYY